MIQDIIDAYKDDPELQNTLEIQELIQKNEHISYLQNKTMESFAKEILDLLKEEFDDSDFIKTALYKLKEYRYVENICDLFKGKHVRWIRLETTPRLTNGGVVVDIRFGKKGMQILVKSNTNKFMQIGFDDCLFFQKLNEDELMILGLQEFALSGS
tara:strand:+ start:1215 stop:1682 length:468 start_codon:yes stop_codon:yes gene_type:complete